MRSASSKSIKLLGIASLLAAAFLLLLFLDRFTFEARTLFWHAVRNFGHVPLFGIMALILLGLLYLSFGERFSALPRYAGAWIGAVGLGAASEYLQIATLRNADLMDWVYDIAGATAFLAFYFSIDPHLSEREKGLRGRIRVPVRIAAVLIVLGAGIPVFTSAASTLHRRAAFPKMYTFDSVLEKKFIRQSHAELEFIEPPDEWQGRDTRVARVTFLPAKYPGLEFQGYWPDWHGYRMLTLDVFSPADSPVNINLMIKDDYNAVFNDRFNREVRIDPGANEIRIPVKDIENSPAKRSMDMTSIVSIHFFVIEPPEPLVLYIDNLFLE